LSQRLKMKFIGQAHAIANFHLAGRRCPKEKTQIGSDPPAHDLKLLIASSNRLESWSATEEEREW